MYNYTPLRTLGVDLISKFGTTAKVTTSTGTATTKAVRTSVDRDNQVTTEEACYLVHGAISRVPAVGDLLEVQSLAYRIVRVEVVNPGPTPLLYKCYV